ncbi:ABC transporter permease [Agromyces protaetiae]|uniref:ABC transporter permease n=1 Tax=Agromyces protaetiae TaxID=2509455 RepID=UPI0024429DDD|nr:ABC transporter permease [Agromyces protaetiae]
MTPTTAPKSTTTPAPAGATPSTTAFQSIEAGKPRFARLRGSLQQLLAAASLVVIVVFFSIANEHFFTANNLVSILTAATVTGILALGTTFVIITGGIDLSIGTGMVLCGVMAGVFLTYWGWPLWAGVLATVLFGGLIGLINGTNISILGIPPFIATLGMMLIASGLSLVISGTKPIYFNDTPSSSRS